MNENIHKRSCRSISYYAKRHGLRVSNELRTYWTDEEKEILKKYYKVEHDNIISRLPGKNLKQINLMAAKLKIYSKKWTDEEINLLKEYHSKFDLSDNNYMNELINKISEINSKHGKRNLIISRLNQLGLIISKPWRKEEDDIIKQFGGKISIQEICEKINNCGYRECTTQILQGRASKLKISLDTKTKFTEVEINILKEKYPIYGTNIKELDKYDKSQIEYQAMKLKLKSGLCPRSKAWTTEEDDIIKTYYSTEGINKCCELLTNRDKNNIMSRASKLGYKEKSTLESVWCEEDNKFLIENYNKMSKEDIAKTLNRTCSSIGAQANRLNLTVNNDWTKEQLEILKNNYENPELSLEDISKLVGRTINSCRAKGNQIGLCRKGYNQTGAPISKDDIEIIKKYYSVEGVKCIERLHKKISEDTLRRYTCKMGIKCDNRKNHTKKILCVETGVVYQSINAAIKVCNDGVRKVLYGKTKTAGGYHWKYISDIKLNRTFKMKFKEMRNK